MRRGRKLIKFETSIGWLKNYLALGFIIVKILEMEDHFEVKLSNGSSYRSIVVPKIDSVPSKKAFMKLLQELYHEA